MSKNELFTYFYEKGTTDIRFTPQELGQHEFSCGMKMQKGSYTVVEKTRKSLSLLQRFWI